MGGEVDGGAKVVESSGAIENNRMRVINYQPSYPTDSHRRGNAEQLKIPVGLDRKGNFSKDCCAVGRVRDARATGGATTPMDNPATGRRAVCAEPVHHPHHLIQITVKYTRADQTGLPDDPDALNASPSINPRCIFICCPSP